MKRIATALIAVSIFCQCDDEDPRRSLINIETFVGSSTSGNVDGKGSQANFNYPFGIDIDKAGNVFVADLLNNNIRKISPDGVVTTVAGTTKGVVDGPVAVAKFNGPVDLAVDSRGNIYVADGAYSETGRVRKITPDGNVSTFVILPVRCIAIDESDNVYIGDRSAVRKITPDKEISILAGSSEVGFSDGLGFLAKFNGISGMTIDKQGNLYVTDFDNTRIRKITPSGEVTTLAGSHEGFVDGAALASKFSRPFGIVIDSDGDLLITDRYNTGLSDEPLRWTLRKASSDGIVSTLAEANWDADHLTTFYSATDVAVDATGAIYFTDSDGHCIRKAR